MSDNKPFEEKRAVFEKKGAAVYFSHLDLSRAVSRALRRSKMKIWLSEGYTPRPHLVFTPPLSLGYESECEMMDFRLKLGEKLDETALKNAFPDTLRILEVYTPKTKLKDISLARWKIELKTPCDAMAVAKALEGPLVLTKKTKRSEQQVDITPFIKRLECKNIDTGVQIDTVLDCSVENTLSPAYILKGLESRGVSFERPKITRLAFLDKNFNIFR